LFDSSQAGLILAGFTEFVIFNLQITWETFSAPPEPGFSSPSLEKSIAWPPLAKLFGLPDPTLAESQSRQILR
jgi:hypothetical protein